MWGRAGVRDAGTPALTTPDAEPNVGAAQAPAENQGPRPCHRRPRAGLEHVRSMQADSLEEAIVGGQVSPSLSTWGHQRPVTPTETQDAQETPRAPSVEPQRLWLKSTLTHRGQTHHQHSPGTGRREDARKSQDLPFPKRPDRAFPASVYIPRPSGSRGFPLIPSQEPCA